MCMRNFWSVADCSLVKQKCRKQKKAASMADLLLCIICPYNSELKIGWPNVKPFWWTDPSKRLQKRLTRLSIANWLSKINEISYSGQNLTLQLFSTCIGKKTFLVLLGHLLHFRKSYVAACTLWLHLNITNGKYFWTEVKEWKAYK